MVEGKRGNDASAKGCVIYPVAKGKQSGGKRRVLEAEHFSRDLSEGRE